MFALLSNTWALLFGMLLLMLGNGMQASLLGIRGALEGFTATEMSVVMSGYFLGFLVSSRAAPEMIRRVGHVRVFAAMASVTLTSHPEVQHFPQSVHVKNCPGAK